MGKLRVALVGCGIISENHIRAYQQHADRAQITVCCDIDRERAAERTTLMGGEVRVTTDYADVLADPDVDSIELCTPHHIHPDAVIGAAKARKHIHCQKPLAKTLEECDAMISACDAAGVTLFYGEMNRTLPAAVLARQVIEEGRIGRVIGMQAMAAHWQGGQYLTTAWRYDPAISGGGQLLDGGIHAVDLLLHLGGQVRSVTCFTNNFRPELGGEDTAVVNVFFASGALGTLFSSQAAGIWFPGANCLVFGTKGVLSLGGQHGALALHRPDLPNRYETLLERNGDGFAAMVGTYLDTVEGKIPNPAPGAVGRENLQFVLAAYESAATGKEVFL